ncbi:MAG: SDR family oxidoreductase [Chloroflexota bacterium]|nr:SDR family oxidoreductase [Chloroflexota bacterium]
MATRNLQDLVVVITGAGRGMGAEYTRAFLEAGSKVVALERSWAGEEEFKKELDANESILTLTCDVTQDADLNNAYHATLERFGTVDVLVNNAAFRTRDQEHEGAIGITILETIDSDWEKAFQVNVFGALKVIRRFIQPMMEKKRGSIINVSTTGSIPSHPQWRPGSREQPYMATKAALTNMTLYLADEIKEQNIAVNVVFPPGARTTGYDERSAERISKGLPATERLSARADTVVPVTKFLARQDASGGVTGMMFTATQWNLEHGLGGHDAWLAPDPIGNPKLTAQLLAGELGSQAPRHGT